MRVGDYTVPGGAESGDTRATRSIARGSRIAADGGAEPSGSRHRVRPEIQALRAWAILAVVAYHLAPGRISGGFLGVDAFFVISGFLISRHLAADFARGVRSPGAFWARRIRRLLPAAFTTLFVTSVVVVAAVPQRLWSQFLGETLASTAYIQNWLLAGDSVNYYASANQPSPVQHFWTLSVEEQFYIAWPLVLLAGVFIGRSLRLTPTTRALFIVALGVTIASFAYTVGFADSSPHQAFFWTTTRAWEFSLGAAMAFAGAAFPQDVTRPASPKLRRRLAALASWIGWGALIAVAFAFDETASHPGWATTLPVAGTALVIAGGYPRHRGLLRLVIDNRGIQYLGAISYSLYLWHWPVLILGPFLLGRELGGPAKVLAFAVSLALAGLSRRWIELPVLEGRPRWLQSTRGAVSALALGMAVVSIVPVLGLRAVHDQQEEYRAWVAELPPAPTGPLEAASSPCFGAVAARWPDTCTPIEAPSLVPSTAEAGTDNGLVGSIPGCHIEDWYDSDLVPCDYVGGTGMGARVLVLGDSHTRPLLALVSGLADRFDWRVTYASKGHCPYSEALVDLGNPRAHEACATWLTRANALVATGDFDLLVTSQKRGEQWLPWDGLSGPASAVAGLERSWALAVGAGTRVLAIEDNPASRADVQECLERHAPAGFAACGTSPDDSLGFDPQVSAARAFSSDDVWVVSFTDLYCDESLCLPAIGGVNVYRDGDHLTATWAATLITVLLDRVPEDFLTDQRRAVTSVPGGIT